MDIQALHQENNAYRDMIISLKAQIREYDMRIQVNEVEIGKQLNEMERIEVERNLNFMDVACTLCMGACDHV